jgi:hypothetical protein
VDRDRSGRLRLRFLSGPFDELPVDEGRSGPDERDQSSAPQTSARAFFAPGCADFGSAPSTLAIS